MENENRISCLETYFPEQELLVNILTKNLKCLVVSEADNQLFILRLRRAPKGPRAFYSELC